MNHQSLPRGTPSLAVMAAIQVALIVGVVMAARRGGQRTARPTHANENLDKTAASVLAA